MRLVHPKKDYHDDSLTAAERAYRIRRYRAALRDWFIGMDHHGTQAGHRTTPRSGREERFCLAFAVGIAHVMGAGTRLTKAQIANLAAAALDDAGYRRANVSKGCELLDLPRVQGRVMEILGERGATLQLAGDVLTRCMKNKRDNDRALAATELFFRVTTGFAVQKSANLHKHERADKFFDDATFANPAKPVIATSQES